MGRCLREFDLRVPLHGLFHKPGHLLQGWHVSSREELSFGDAPHRVDGEGGWPAEGDLGARGGGGEKDLGRREPARRTRGRGSHPTPRRE